MVHTRASSSILSNNEILDPEQIMKKKWGAKRHVVQKLAESDTRTDTVEFYIQEDIPIELSPIELLVNYVCTYGKLKKNQHWPKDDYFKDLVSNAFDCYASYRTASKALSKILVQHKWKKKEEAVMGYHKRFISVQVRHKKP